MADSASNSENAPLLPPPVTAPQIRRTVTFKENPVSKTIEPEIFSRTNSSNSNTDRLPTYGSTFSGTSGGGTLSSASLGGLGGGGMGSSFAGFNSKLRRRNSAGPSGIGHHASGGASGGNSSTSGSSTSGMTAGGAAAAAGAAAGAGGPKIGPQRSTKTAGKLKELPLPDFGDEGPDEESGREVYSQYTRIKDPKARRDAARLGKADRDRLPRVTAYCTANEYQLDSLLKWLKASAKKRGTNPKRIDECLYSPYSYTFRRNAIANEESEDALLGGGVTSGAVGTGSLASGVPEAPPLDTSVVPIGPITPTVERFGSEGMFSPVPSTTGDTSAAAEGNSNTNADHGREATEASSLSAVHADVADMTNHDPDFDVTVDMAEIFLFEYGVVVIWGMTEAQELRLLKEISKWSPVERLNDEQIETEYFNYYYTRDYQARIYNDFIALRKGDKKNYMTKLAISHGLAQSVKTNLYEELIAVELEGSKDLPAQIAMAGKMAMSKTEINMKIGKLFMLRIQVHLNGSVLDTPELFWTEPHLEPVYQATRHYLEMDQRIDVLANRLSVIGDLLTVLKDQLSHGHGEYLEWIVIILIAAEILVAFVNIIVDVYAGVEG